MFFPVFSLMISVYFQPFADGLVTVIVPNLGRGENSLLLWNNARQSAPICSFQGHSDVILDFAWRPNRHYDNSDMVNMIQYASESHTFIQNYLDSQELVTWSRDQTLRVWNVDETIQKMCEPDTPDEEGKQIMNFVNFVEKKKINLKLFNIFFCRIRFNGHNIRRNTNKIKSFNTSFSSETHIAKQSASNVSNTIYIINENSAKLFFTT